MRAAFEGYEETALKPVFDHLEGRISYGKLRLFRAIESPASAVASSSDLHPRSTPRHSIS